MPKNKPWHKPARAARPVDTRNRRRTAIFCEDAKSSADYFKSFPIDKERFSVEVVPTGMNTDSLVERAVEAKRKAFETRSPYSAVWCVFDRDSFPSENYDRAFHLAKNEGIQVAWANEAFELWYLLHFDYFDSALSRADYKQKLADRDIAYDKADKTMYARLEGRQETAIRNARKLESYWNRKGTTHPHRHNPSTSMHRLVGHLNELAALGTEPTPKDAEI
jgi:hypothetical protein